MSRWLGGLDLGLMEAIFDQHPEGPFFIKDAELRYVAANIAMLRLCGVARREQLLGRTAHDVFPPRLAQGYEAMDREVIATGVAIENRLQLASAARGTARWLLFSRRPVRDAEGRIVGVVASSSALASGARADPVYRRLALVLDHMREHARSPLSLAELARLAGISASQVERDFSRILKITPREHLRRLRLEIALRLLETPMTIAQVAHESGYADHSAFSRQFHREMGSSPSDYRKHTRNSPEA